jgi:acetyl esterase
MALDKATAALLAQLASTGAGPLHELTPAEARGAAAALRGQQPPGPEMARVRDARVRAAGGTFPVRVLVPGERPRGVIVYYHGGGWVIGGIDDTDLLGRELARRTGCAVVLPGYRLAPEYRYPTAVEDSQAALRWAADHLADIAGAQVPLIVAGDSAGGNLATVIARRACLAGPAIAAQVLIYPVTDCDFGTTSYTDPDNDLLLSRDSMIWFWDHYAPDPPARLHPDASPLRAPDLAGLPPAIIITAEHDVLRDEGELYATRLLKAGVPVTHRRFAGQMHGFFTMAGVLPGSAAAIEFAAAALDQQLGDQLGSRPALADIA